VSAAGIDSAGASQSTDIHRRTPIGRRTIAKLTSDICAPTLDPAALQERTGVFCAGADRHNPAAQSGGAYRKAGCRRCPVTQLPSAVDPPTLDATRLQQRASIVVTSGQRHGCAPQANDIRWDQMFLGRAVAKLTGNIRPPTFDAAVLQERTSMFSAKRHGGDTGQTGHIDWPRTGQLGAIAQLPIAVAPPTLQGA
jgi:hypothetical protein